MNNDNTNKVVNGNSQPTNNTNNPTVVNPLEVKVEPSESKEQANQEVNTDTTSQQVASDNSSNVKQISPSQVNGEVNNTENLKRVEINYTPPSKFKMFLLVVFLVGLIVFVLFLPDINTMVNKYKAGKQVNEIITTGTMNCSFKTHTAELDKEYVRVFDFTDSKLEKADYTITTKGDPSLDEATLTEMNKKCVGLEEEVDSLTGITVSCKYSDGKLVERQIFEFQAIDKEQIDAAFAEAGGEYPEFSYNQDISEVERTMLAAGYSCVRNKR